MPYLVSQARKTAKAEFKTIKSRIKKSQKKVLEPVIREYVLAASIFLAHATLENYISDIFSGFANGIQSSPIKGSALPDNLRAHLFLRKIDTTKLLGSTLGMNAESDTLKSISKSLKNDAGTVVDNSQPIFKFRGADIYTNKKYPSPENLVKIFERLGVPKIFQNLDSIIKRDSKNLLESLGSLRSELAHTGQIPGISPEDVIKKIRDIEVFVSALDKVMYKTTASAFGDEVWRSHLR